MLVNKQINIDKHQPKTLDLARTVAELCFNVEIQKNDKLAEMAVDC